ncbi:MAG TPA: hypothetical protein VGI99_05445 [Gemmataceae bacterium]
MSSDKTVTAWQIAIISEATAKLGRELTDKERQFITNRGLFIALEAIADTVRDGTKEEVEQYLNSE